MGIYSHYTAEELSALRDRLTASLHDRLANPTVYAKADQRLQYDQQIAEIRKEISAVVAEISARSGRAERRPIYLV